MSRMQREKGKVFERKIAAQLREVMPRATIHRSSQADRAYDPDVVIYGDAPWLGMRLWLELTDGRAPDPAAKLDQAENDARLNVERTPGIKKSAAAVFDCWLPVVVWHRLGERRIWATMRLVTLNDIFLGERWGSQPVIVTCPWRDILERLRFCDGIAAIPPKEATK